MNACLQCLLPIDELRDYFTLKEYLDFDGVPRKKANFEFNAKFHHFFSMVFSKSSSAKKQWVLNADFKRLIKKNFDPLMQHDSHEFLVYLLE